MEKKYTYKQWQERVTITENEWGVERERVKKIPSSLITYKTDNLMVPLDTAVYGRCYDTYDDGHFLFEKQVGKNEYIRTHQQITDNY